MRTIVSYLIFLILWWSTKQTPSHRFKTSAFLSWKPQLSLCLPSNNPAVSRILMCLSNSPCCLACSLFLLPSNPGSICCVYQGRLGFLALNTGGLTAPPADLRLRREGGLLFVASNTAFWLALKWQDKTLQLSEDKAFWGSMKSLWY